MNTPTPIDFTFDFSSPYAYLMSEKIDRLAGRFGRQVRWHPILLGVIFQHIGSAPPANNPFKGAYMRLDVVRSARYLGVPFRWPDCFPIPTQAAARSYYWLHAQDCTLGRRFAHAIFRALFIDGQDISAPETVLDIAADLGVERTALEAALGGAALKAQLKAACADAIAQGIFGAPWVVIDGEAYWGVDRLPQMEAQLAVGEPR